MNLIILYSIFIALIITVILLINSYCDSKETWNDRTKEECGVVAYGTYEDFLHQMYKSIWKRDDKYPRSFFQENSRGMTNVDKYYVHAGIFIFEGIGMIFKKRDYRLVQKWLDEHESKKVTIVKNDYRWE